MLALICYTTREAQGQNLLGIGKGIDRMQTFFLRDIYILMYQIH